MHVSVQTEENGRTAMDKASVAGGKTVILFLVIVIIGQFVERRRR